MNASGDPTGRLFIAVPLPRRLARSLHLLASRLEQQLPGRYVPEENYHVTLAFIGDAPLQLEEELQPFLVETAAHFARIQTAFSAFGHFGPAANAILWAGLQNGDALLPLAETVRAGLTQRRVPFDRKAVRPHITVARKVNLTGFSLPPLPGDAGQLDTLILYHSTRVRGRLTYLPLVQAPLG